MYHGLADAIVPPGISTTYWKSVTEKMDGAEAVSKLLSALHGPWLRSSAASNPV